jgi:hypothetical protein
MGGTRMADHQGPSSQTEGIRPDDCAVRRIRELESAHGIEADDPDPIRDQCIFPALGRQHSPVRMRYHSGTESAEDRRSEMMVWMVMRKHNPFHRLKRYRADGAEEVLPLARTRQRIDDDDARVGDDKARVGSSLGASPRIADGSVYAGGKRPDGKRPVPWSRDPPERRHTENDTPTSLQGSHQYEPAGRNHSAVRPESVRRLRN